MQKVRRQPDADVAFLDIAKENRRGARRGNKVRQQDR
jgi:hypothetical protein